MSQHSILTFLSCSSFQINVLVGKTPSFRMKNAIEKGQRKSLLNVSAHHGGGRRTPILLVLRGGQGGGRGEDGLSHLERARGR